MSNTRLRSGAAPPAFSLSLVSFRADQVRGALDRDATVDYRLVRRHLINEVKRKRLSRVDVCDAHPELIRAAEHLGTTTASMCPICEEQPLVHVTYAFGHGLPAFGRCLSSVGELAKLRRAHQELAVYVVEVCTGCRWNHLARSFRLTRAKPTAAKA